MSNEVKDVQKNNLMVAPSPHIKDSLTTKQIMIHVVIALVPAVIAATYYFGIRALMMTVICVAGCVVFEHLFAMLTKRPTTIGDFSAVVTGVILACNLPAALPFWMALVGCFLAIVVIKGLFGGIGCNFANPAATARIFMLISFATPMTTWIAPRGVDATATATPLALLANGGEALATATPAQTLPSLMQMFLGQRGGSLGETCALALIIGGVYLIAKGIIDWKTPVAVIGSVFVFALLFGQDPFYAILSGGVMIGAFFMATDYSTSPVTDKGKVIFAVGIGFITMVIRCFCSYPEGISFAILLMNIITPHIDNLTITKPFGAIFEEKKKEGAA